MRLPIMRYAVLAAAVLGLSGCGSSAPTAPSGSGIVRTSTVADTIPQGKPHAIQPTAGQQAPAVTATDPVGDIHAHAPPLSQIRSELKLQAVAARVTNATYVDPLQYVNHWERTDQGVDATMPVGAPILAPSRIKVLAIVPNWYLKQPLVYFELLEGPDAGRVQFVAEEITSIAPPGSYLAKGQAIARYAAAGTGIEYGWSTLNGITLARATSGYEEGQITPAGRWMRAWLNALGAGAGRDF
ncbi:MAG: hypothetical protein ACJ780_11420 [Solirubrobacteraceae bacterium]